MGLRCVAADELKPALHAALVQRLPPPRRVSRLTLSCALKSLNVSNNFADKKMVYQTISSDFDWT